MVNGKFCSCRALPALSIMARRSQGAQWVLLTKILVSESRYCCRKLLSLSLCYFIGRMRPILSGSQRALWHAGRHAWVLVLYQRMLVSLFAFQLQNILSFGKSGLSMKAFLPSCKKPPQRGTPKALLWLEQGLWTSLAFRHRRRDICKISILVIIILQS